MTTKPELQAPPDNGRTTFPIPNPNKAALRRVMQKAADDPAVSLMLIGKSIIYCFLLVAIFFMYITVNAEGLRIIAPFFGQPLSEFPLPFVHYIDSFEGWREINCAHLVAFLYYFISIYACHLIVSALKNGVEELSLYDRQVLAVSFIVVVIDGILFYFGAISRALGAFGGGSSFSPTMILLTFAYLIMLLVVAHWGIGILELKKEVLK